MREVSIKKENVSCGVGRRCGSDLACLRFWCRLTATALIGPLAWEPPYAMGVALNKTKKEKERKKERKKGRELQSGEKIFSFRVTSFSSLYMLLFCCVLSFRVAPVAHGGS